jgi:antibiotic biosynthesis monooxygenase (ABM) superfamily enzyme
MSAVSNHPVHVAITRRVKPGCEDEFEQSLRDFFRASLGHSSVLGAHMLAPPPGSNSREFGILRTFVGAAERDAFYKSELFKEWSDRARTLTEGEPLYRQLTGFEAWFRSPEPPPPTWKMMFLTFVAVWPISMAIPPALMPLIGNAVSNTIFAGAVAAGIVLVLTWPVMPLLTRIFHRWLYPENLNRPIS